MKNTFNDIGIGKDLDWPRIRKLFIIGLCAGFVALMADIILGYGVADKNVSGIEGMLSAYLNLSDSRIFWSSFLGFIAIPIEALCYFGIYRLIVPYSEKYAHLYRTGIIGYLAFAGCGVHVPCLASVFFYKYMMEVNSEKALELSIRFGSYFLLPGMIMLIIFWLIHSYAQISAFAKGLTPYPKWCFIFSMPIGMLATELLHFIGNHAIVNALTAGWISIGNIWMFAGLLIIMNKAVANKYMKKLPKGTYKAVKNYLENNYPDKKVKDILDATTCLYSEFIEEAPGGLNILRKQYYGGLSVFAFYEVMNREISEDVLQDVLWSMLLGGGDINKKKNIHVNLNNQFIQKVGYSIVSRYAKYVNNKADSGKWKNVWKIESNSYNRKNGFCMALLNCPVARFAKEHGYGHLMPLFCGSDFKVVEKYGLKLIRTHTEAEGYCDCDFWYLNKDSEEI